MLTIRNAGMRTRSTATKNHEQQKRQTARQVSGNKRPITPVRVGNDLETKHAYIMLAVFPKGVFNRNRIQECFETAYKSRDCQAINEGSNGSKHDSPYGSTPKQPQPRQPLQVQDRYSSTPRSHRYNTRAARKAGVKL